MNAMYKGFKTAKRGDNGREQALNGQWHPAEGSQGTTNPLQPECSSAHEGARFRFFDLQRELLGQQKTKMGTHPLEWTHSYGEEAC